ncbi:unnamed protein product, partial [Citrullus colocynthis]
MKREDERGVSQQHNGQKRVHNYEGDVPMVDDLNLNSGGEWVENSHEDVGCDLRKNESMVATPTSSGHLLGNVSRMVDTSIGCGTSGARPSTMQSHSSSAMNVE